MSPLLNSDHVKWDTGVKGPVQLRGEKVKLAFLKARRKSVLSSDKCVLVASGEARHNLPIQNEKVIQPARLCPVPSGVQQKEIGFF